MRLTPLRLILLFRELGTKLTEKRTLRRLARTQRRLRRVEKEKQHLLHRWSLLDKSLQVQRAQKEERQLPMPPHLATLDQYLAARKAQETLRGESLSELTRLYQEQETLTTPTLPPSLTRQPPSS